MLPRDFHAGHEIRGQELLKLGGQFCDPVRRLHTFAARPDDPQVGVVGLPQYQILDRSPEVLHACQFIRGPAGLLDFRLDHRVQLPDPFQHRRFRLGTIHPGERVMDPGSAIVPGIQDADVLQHLVGGDAGDLVQGKASLGAGFAPILQQQKRFPIARLHVHLSFEHLRHRGIRPLRCSRLGVGLPQAQEIVLRGIVLARSIHPRRLRP